MFLFISDSICVQMDKCQVGFGFIKRERETKEVEIERVREVYKER